MRFVPLNAVRHCDLLRCSEESTPLADSAARAEGQKRAQVEGSKEKK